MKHSIEILRSAQKQLAKIDQHQRPRLYQAIRQLADDPRPPGTKKLSGRAAWRIRVGSYRIIYEIHEDRLLVLVVAIGDRKDLPIGSCGCRTRRSDGNATHTGCI